MKIVLWIGQVLLAVMFANAGYAKLMTPMDTLTESMPWAAAFPDWGVRAIAIAELLGAIGLILPALTGIARILTPLAATGLAVTMAGAIITHLVMGDPPSALLTPAVPLVVAAAVAGGWFYRLGQESKKSGEVHAS